MVPDDPLELFERRRFRLFAERFHGLPLDRYIRVFPDDANECRDRLVRLDAAQGFDGLLPSGLAPVLPDDIEKDGRRSAVLDIAERFDCFNQRIVVGAGRDQVLERRQCTIGRLIRESLGGFASDPGVRRVHREIGERRDRLRRLHLANRFCSLHPHLVGRIVPCGAQQNLH
jgi:hypothetical protein